MHQPPKAAIDAAARVIEDMEGRYSERLIAEPRALRGMASLP